MTKTILIIEDDNDINRMLSEFLQRKGFNTVSAYSGTEGLMVHGEQISLILLDLMLPGRSGEEIIKDLKAKHRVPVIVMSAIHEVEKKVNLFALGAEDYITKPFHNDELLARITARLRTSEAHEKANSNISCGNITLDSENYLIICNGNTMKLSLHEYKLLYLLMENSGRVCTKSMIYDIVWDDENSADDNTLNVHISKLRKKLKECGSDSETIETVWGIGYRFKKK